jgi:hypothetical protein
VKTAKDAKSRFFVNQFYSLRSVSAAADMPGSFHFAVFLGVLGDLGGWSFQFE